MAGFLEIVSFLFGWIYTFCWSASFYPQPIHNFRRGSTRGTTIDFPAVNVLGFIAYFIFNVAFLYSPTIRKQYALRHHGHTPAVRFNDLAFAGHAVIMAMVVLSQFSKRLWGLEKARGIERRVSKPILAVIVISLVAPLFVTVYVAARKDKDVVNGWAWIDVVGLLTHITLHLILTTIDIHILLRQTPHNICQVYPASHHQLSQPVHKGMVDCPDHA